MKLATAVIMVAVGIWLAYNKPELADVAIMYINMALDFVVSLIDGAEF